MADPVPGLTPNAVGKRIQRIREIAKANSDNSVAGSSGLISATPTITKKTPTSRSGSKRKKEAATEGDEEMVVEDTLSKKALAALAGNKRNKAVIAADDSADAEEGTPSKGAKKQKRQPAPKAKPTATREESIESIRLGAGEAETCEEIPVRPEAGDETLIKSDPERENDEV